MCNPTILPYVESGDYASALQNSQRLVKSVARYWKTGKILKTIIHYSQEDLVQDLNLHLWRFFRDLDTSILYRDSKNPPEQQLIGLILKVLERRCIDCLRQASRSSRKLPVILRAQEDFQRVNGKMPAIDDLCKLLPSVNRGSIISSLASTVKLKPEHLICGPIELDSSYELGFYMFLREFVSVRKAYVCTLIFKRGLSKSDVAKLTGLGASRVTQIVQEVVEVLQENITQGELARDECLQRILH